MSVDGSSPLARGLPDHGPVGVPDERIIPARAGFTPRETMSPLTAHGSSPLARGLREPESRRRLGRRIIPARAGFTMYCPLRPERNRDHPRSRGVYALVAVSGFIARGSSPLARGLPATLCSECSAYRIIPARAGFTMYCPLRPERNRDHPRSRGVYGMLDFGDTIEEGIIPARAGFTYLRIRSLT